MVTLFRKWKQIENETLLDISIKDTDLKLLRRTLETIRKALCMLIMVSPSRSSPRKRPAHRNNPLSLIEGTSKQTGDERTKIPRVPIHSISFSGFKTSHATTRGRGSNKSRHLCRQLSWRTYRASCLGALPSGAGKNSFNHRIVVNLQVQGIALSEKRCR